VGKKKKKVKKKCCEKYLKSGKHCKKCPVFVQLKDREKKKNKKDKKK